MLQRGLGLRSADDFSKPPLQAGRQSGATQSAAVPQTRGLWQGPGSMIPAFMFALQHLDSFKAPPCDVQVKGKGNGNPS